MPILVWDKLGDKVYESGLDRGVLYLPDGSAVPWNGLTSVIEKFDKTTVPIYYDGMKVNDLVSLGTFSATMKAITYPDEFVAIEGSGQIRAGLFLGDQPPQVFGLCYRTQVGNDVDGDVAGYKIHIIYNVTAIPSEKTYASAGGDPSIVEFEWDITAIPNEIPGWRPTAHMIINSIDYDPFLLEDLETMLYGDTDTFAALVPMPDLITTINNFYRVKITDNGDGTWTATSMRDGFIFLETDEAFEIDNVNAIYTDDDTYIIYDTIDVADVPEIQITDNGDGTWTAIASSDALIVTNTDGSVTIYDADIINLGPDSYQITNTSDD